MKRIFALALAMTLLLCGCGKGDDTTDKGGHTNEGGNNPAVGVLVPLGSTASVELGGPLTAEQKADLGEAVEVQEAPSCHYDGMDTVTTYNGFIIQTFRQDDEDIVCLVEIQDPNLATEKGVRVGDDRDGVTAAYGDPEDGTDYYMTYTYAKGMTLTFELRDGKVSAILYELTA